MFHHNAIDILTLACLTGIVPYALQGSRRCSVCGNGAEMAGIARWLREAGELEQALQTVPARDRRRPAPTICCSARCGTSALLERKLGADPMAIWTDLASAKNPFRVKALEELAKHYEHREKDYDGRWTYP